MTGFYLRVENRITVGMATVGDSCVRLLARSFRKSPGEAGVRMLVCTVHGSARQVPAQFLIFSVEHGFRK